MSFKRKMQRQEAKALYKKAVKGIPRQQRVPFSKIYKTLIAKEQRLDNEDDAMLAADLGKDADLLADLISSDPDVEEKKNDSPDTTTVEQDLIL